MTLQSLSYFIFCLYDTFLGDSEVCIVLGAGNKGHGSLTSAGHTKTKRQQSHLARQHVL